VNKWVAKKVYHARRSLLPGVLALNVRKIASFLHHLLRGTVAIPVFRNSSTNLTFIVLSKNGRRKLYEIDTDPVVFRRAYEGLEGSILPQMHTCEPPFVCAEWIEGETLSSTADAGRQALALANLLAGIHAFTPSETPRRFLHLERLHRRFDRNLGALDEEGRRLALALRDDIDRTYAGIAAQLDVSCVHPDLIASNVIVTSGRHVVVDNEFFSAGTGKEFDVLNTMRSLPEDAQAAFLARYGELADLTAFHEHRLLWENVYVFKRLSRCMRYRHRPVLRQLLDSLRNR